MFIQTEATPNPATLKFIPGQEVLQGDPRDFRDAQEAANQSPLAGRLFEIDNVCGVFLGSDFIAVTKEDGEWQHLKPAILGAIMEHFMSDAPILAGEADETAEGKEVTIHRRATLLNGSGLIFIGSGVRADTSSAIFFNIQDMSIRYTTK